MKNNILFLVFLLLLLIGCDELPIQGFFIPTSATVETRFSQSMSWNKNNPDYFTIDVPSDDYSVYVCGDVHVEKTTKNITRFLLDELSDTSAHFSIVLGDMVKDRDGMQILFDDIYTTPVVYDPMYVVAGNHDLYFNLWENFYELFGSSTYSLTVQTPSYKDLYIFLDNAGGSFGASQLDWLKRELAEKRAIYRHCFVSAHVNIFRNNRPMSEIANLPLEETFDFGKIMSDYDVDLVLQGHEHYRAYTEYRGVGYLTLDAIADWFEDASYIIMDVASEVDYQCISLTSE